MKLAQNSDALARLLLVANINFASRIIADQYRGQTRPDVRLAHELGHVAGKILLNLRGQRLAV